ncbi:molybdopterin converting factor subunit 1 [Bartonella sp. LJL80]
MKLRYFAWVRERIGRDEEDLAIPDTVVTVADLLRFLRSLGDNYAYALEAPELIRVAIDQEHVEHDIALAGASEVALFPPMTGG